MANFIALLKSFSNEFRVRLVQIKNTLTVYGSAVFLFAMIVTCVLITAEGEPAKVKLCFACGLLPDQNDGTKSLPVGGVIVLVLLYMDALAFLVAAHSTCFRASMYSDEDYSYETKLKCAKFWLAYSSIFIVIPITIDFGVGRQMLVLISVFTNLPRLAGIAFLLRYIQGLKAIMRQLEVEDEEDEEEYSDDVVAVDV